MARTRCEHALGRLLAYLHWSGVALTPDVIRVALQTVEQALADSDDDLFARVMARIPQCFELPDPGPAATAPPIHRSSIGYHG